MKYVVKIKIKIKIISIHFEAMIADVDKENSSGVETSNNFYVTIGNFLFLAPTKSKTVEADFDEAVAIASNMNFSDKVTIVTNQSFFIENKSKLIPF
jgi:hypothetical protein